MFRRASFRSTKVEGHRAKICPPCKNAFVLGLNMKDLSPAVLLSTRIVWIAATVRSLRRGVEKHDDWSSVSNDSLNWSLRLELEVKGALAEGDVGV